MAQTKTFERYPIWIVGVSTLNSLLIYVMGFIIMLEVEAIFAILFAAYVAALEIRLVKNYCVNCHYYGKVCGFGKGVFSKMFFKKGQLSFCKMQITWKDLIPDILVPVIPLAFGIIVLAIQFKSHILYSMIAILLLSSIGNGFIRSSLTCKYCRQRELGCPAEKLFNKNTKKMQYEKSNDLSAERVG